MNSSLVILFSLLFVVGVLVPAYAQTNSAHVVINEVDINPPGNDATSVSEWVEIYNPTNSNVDLGGWTIASTTVLKKTMTIPSGTIIKPGQFLTYSYQSLWFTDSSESVELKNSNGVVVDKTPVISDIHNDFKSWQRLYDGYDFDSFGDWKFASSTAGSSNGKLVVAQDTDKVTVNVSTDKSSYLFGEIASITGNISKEVFIVKPTFQSQPILVKITGPNYDKTISLYPDYNLNYKTSLTLHQVLGIAGGTYDVNVSYGDSTANTSFSVGFELTQVKEKEDSSLSITTDKSQYIPGQSVSITGHASEIVSFEGMKLIVKDSQGNVISDGNLYPTKGKFATSVYLSTVKPVYGTFEISATYSDKSVTSTFEVVEDLKENVPISLWADKKAYSLGEQVKISGRVNQVWVSTLDLEIVQTKQTSVSSSLSGSDAGFKILDGVRILGDGTFSYTFTIPDNKLRLGDYRISVSKEIGTATAVIHAVSNPDTFVASNVPFTVNSDKDVYEIGDTMTLSGFIAVPRTDSSYTTGTPVKISISNEDGTPLQIVGQAPGAKTFTKNGVVVAYDFTAIPETSGSYSLNIPITKTVFSEGNYIVKSQYGGYTATKTISIVNPLDLKEGAILSLNKEIYGLGETVTLTGTLPPTATHTVKIELIKPDGTTVLSGTSVDKQRFSWSWTAPMAEKTQNIKVNEGRDVVKSNFGIYKIKVSYDNNNRDVFFKISADPANDSLFLNPLFISTEQSLYHAGDKLKVVGSVIKRAQGSEGLVVPERVTIKVLDGVFPYKQIHESAVYPNQGGDFTSFFDLPATVFKEGIYTVKATYSKYKSETNFSVANDFTFGVDAPASLLLSSDKTEYYPGDTVIVSGKPNKLIYLEKFDVSVSKKSESQITCGSFSCGKHIGSVTTIRPSSSGSFTYEYKIPASSSSIGTYEVVVDADFETKYLKFNVVEKPATPKLNILIEKENRISDDVILISTGTKTSDDSTFGPRVLSGSLIVPTRGSEYDVNLQVSSTSGICVIGPSDECLVKESTRKPGQIYDVVDIDGNMFNVRYSGPDVRLESFSIVPESSTEFLPDTEWEVEILKEEQISRFYYKVTYKNLE